MKFITVCISLLLVGCVSTDNSNLREMNIPSNLTANSTVDTVVLPDSAKKKLQASLTRNHNKNAEDADKIAARMRIKAISIDAYSWGLQEGMYFRTTVIQNLLEKHSGLIHKMISLGKFIVDGKMLMPTVIESKRLYVKNSDVSSTEINMAYTLDKMPRIVSQVPTWRDYLKRSVSLPESPLEHALPKNKEEQLAWDMEFRRGWSGGTKQADLIYSNDLSRMHSDIAGLYRYRYLLSQNIVLLPTISNEKTGVVILDSGKTIYLNNVEHSIEMDSIFNNVNEWKPVFYQGDAHE